MEEAMINEIFRGIIDNLWKAANAGFDSPQYKQAHQEYLQFTETQMHNLDRPDRRGGSQANHKHAIDESQIYKRLPNSDET